MNRYRKNHRAALGAYFLAGLFLTAFVAVLAIVFLHPHVIPLVGGGGIAVLFLSGTVLTTEEFQTTVLGGVKKLGERQEEFQKSTEKLLSDTDRLDKETKKSFEELRKVANDQDAALKALQKIQLKLHEESLAAGFDPIQRIVRDERKRGIMNAVVRAAMCDNDSEYKRFVTPILKAIGEDSGEGATLIVLQLYKEIYDTLAEYGDWSTLGVRRLGTKITNFPIKSARAVANWISTEAAAIADDTNEAGSTMTLTVLPNAVLLNVSRQLIEDSEFDVTSMVMDDFQEAFNLRLDTAAFIGSGTNASVAVDGGFTGLFTGTVQVSAALGNVSVEQLAYDDLLKCLTAVAPIVLKRKPCWWVHPQMLARLMSIKDNNGRPIFLGALEAPSYGAIGTILGFPVIPVFVAPNTDAPGSPVIAFGDRNTQVVGIRQDFVFEASDHYRWNTLERSFRAYGRAASGTRIPNGGSTLSTSAR
jgi:HK97 family phage major capsid protein